MSVSVRHASVVSKKKSTHTHTHTSIELRTQFAYNFRKAGACETRRRHRPHVPSPTVPISAGPSVEFPVIGEVKASAATVTVASMLRRGAVCSQVLGVCRCASKPEINTRGGELRLRFWVRTLISLATTSEQQLRGLIVKKNLSPISVSNSSISASRFYVFDGRRRKAQQREVKRTGNLCRTGKVI